MKTPLEVIKDLGAPTDSPVRAIHYLTRVRDSLSKKKCEQLGAEIIGTETPLSFRNLKEATLYFHYIVQETIIADIAAEGGIPDMPYVWKRATMRAERHIKNNPWSIKDYESENTTDEEGKPKAKKGDKQRQTEEIYLQMNDGNTTHTDIIQAFIDDAGMTKGGATTYFHNLKKKHPFIGPKPVRKPKAKKAKTEATAPKKKATKRRGKSKGAKAREIYNEMIATDPNTEKKAIIARIVEETGTSKAGANTYFCAARKEANDG